MRQQNCPNCGASFDAEVNAECPHCGEAQVREIWRSYFLISFFATPALAIGLPLWIPLIQAYAPAMAQISIVALIGVEFVGAGVSAYLLARSEGKRPNGADIVGYWMLFVALYAIIGGAVLWTI